VTNPLDGSFPEQQVVLENDHCVFVRTPQPVLKGSGLIVTKAARETVFDLTPQEWAATYELLQKAKAYLDRTLGPDGYNVGWNVGRVVDRRFPTYTCTSSHASKTNGWRAEGFATTSRGRRIGVREGF